MSSLLAQAPTDLPLTMTLVFGLVQLVTVAGGAVWVVASVRSKTEILAASITTLSGSIDKFGRSIDRLEDSLRDLDRRVTTLEVHNKRIGG